LDEEPKGNTGFIKGQEHCIEGGMEKMHDRRWGGGDAEERGEGRGQLLHFVSKINAWGRRKGQKRGQKVLQGEKYVDMRGGSLSEGWAEPFTAGKKNEKPSPGGIDDGYRGKKKRKRRASQIPRAGGVHRRKRHATRLIN